MTKLNSRQNDILVWLQSNEQLQVEELATQFEVSQQTIRKDINQMCELGLVRRLHGGVSLPAPLHNSSFVSREFTNEDIKAQLGKITAQLIPNGSSILLGIGTTALYTARALENHKELRIITNNLRAAEILCQQPEHEVYVAGGKLRHSDQDVVGEQTSRFFDSFYVDFGILGSGALLPQHGLMEYDPIEAEIGNAIARNASEIILVADHSKWKRKATVKSLSFNQVHQFVTSELEDKYLPYIPEHCHLHTLSDTYD